MSLKGTSYLNYEVTTQVNLNYYNRTETPRPKGWGFFMSTDFTLLAVQQHFVSHLSYNTRRCGSGDLINKLFRMVVIRGVGKKIYVLYYCFASRRWRSRKKFWVKIICLCNSFTRLIGLIKHCFSPKWYNPYRNRHVPPKVVTSHQELSIKNYVLSPNSISLAIQNERCP